MSYVDAAIEISKQEGVTCIDLGRIMTNLFNEIGPEEADKYYLTIDEGVSDNFPEGKIDASHLQTFGARMLAKAFCMEIVKTDSTFASLVDPDEITGNIYPENKIN
jgi:hypothetical protein